MKKIIIFVVSIIVVLLATIISCSKSTIIDIAIPRDLDTSKYMVRSKVDTTERNDSVPITFTIEVEGWKEIEINY